MDKLQDIKNNYCPYDENYCLDAEQVAWLIEQTEKVEQYEKALKKIIEMESPFYHRETQSETPYNYARVALERK